MKKEFKALSNYIALFDGHGKPKLNFQEMYKLFPNFTFLPSEKFGQYENFGEAFENKNLSMIVISNTGNECYITYKEYMDVNENTAYVS